MKRDRQFTWVLIFIACVSTTAYGQQNSSSEIDTYLLAWHSSASAIWSYDIHADVIVRVTRDGSLFDRFRHRVRQRYLLGDWRIDILKSASREREESENLYAGGAGFIAEC